MPPKAKRYRVLAFDPLLNTWRRLTGPLTAKDADALLGKIMWDTRKEEVQDD